VRRSRSCATPTTPLKTTSQPVVSISARAAARLRAGHPWVYRSDVSADPRLAAGALVAVKDPRGKPLGSALYSSSSQIAVRLVSTRPLAGRDGVLALVRERIAG